MNERLDLGCELDDFEASLVASGKREGMGVAKKRALALALAGGAAAATLGAAGTAKTATVATASLSATKAKGAAGLAILKWIAAGLTGSALAVGATTSAVHIYELRQLEVAARTAPAQPAQSPSPTSIAVAQPTNVAPPAKEEAPTVTTTELPSAPPVAVAPIAKPAIARASKPDDASKLSDEIKTIEQARAALGVNHVTEAARALDEHDRNFPNGAFAEESRVLRIDVHARRGDVALAKREAKAYLAAHPSSPYAPRVRLIVGDGVEP